MRNLSNALLRYIHDEICIIRGLVNVVNTREALDFTATSLGIVAAAIVLLTVLDRRRDMHEEEVVGTTPLEDRLARKAARMLIRSDGRRNHSSTCARKLTGHKSDTLQVLVAVFRRETKL